MGSNPNKWDYKAAAMESAGALTFEKINERKRKAREKKKKARQRKKEQQRAAKKDVLVEQIASGLAEYNSSDKTQMKNTNITNTPCAWSRCSEDYEDEERCGRRGRNNGANQ